jgi:L-iditol 2-dehydrogenase
MLPDSSTDTEKIPFPGASMKALVLHGPEQLSIEQVPVPRPGPGEVLCRVKAVAICGTDPKIIKGALEGIGWPPEYPYILGHEWAGQVVQAGEGVSQFAPGDRVVGEPHKGCGYCARCMEGRYNLCQNYGKNETGHRHYGFTAQGAYAEYFATSVKAIHHLPNDISYPEAAIVDSAAVALNGLRRAGVEPGSTAVVIGPGAIGLCALQLVRAMGATRVIAIGRKGRRLTMAGELGAETVDALSSDPVEAVMALNDGVGADITVDASGAQAACAYMPKITRFGGRIVLLGFFVPGDVVFPLQDVVFKEQTIYGVRANPNVDDQVVAFIEAGKLDVRPIVSHTFPLDDFTEALDTFVNRKDGAMKVVVEP